MFTFLQSSPCLSTFGVFSFLTQEIQEIHIFYLQLDQGNIYRVSCRVVVPQQAEGAGGGEDGGGGEQEPPPLPRHRLQAGDVLTATVYSCDNSK